MNRQWLLASRPQGMVSPENFEWREADVPEPGEGQALVRNLYLSLDPAMRGWMSDAPSYVPPVGIGEVMRGGCVARVERSNDPELAEGSLVAGMFGWQDYALTGGEGPLRPSRIPDGVEPALALGALGMTALTAYWGLAEIGKPQPGETVVVSAAAGATGSVVGQIAKIRGCRVIGIAGGPEKCALLTGELGFDGAIDYRSEKVAARLRELCPDGIDVYWDNVGGEILEAALANLAMHARIVICGAISQYNAETPPGGPRNYMNLLVKRSRMEGFLVFDYAARNGEALAELVPWVTEGKVRQPADVRDGLENAPAALLDLFEGRNSGKLMVRIAS
ncbi:MAG TPA: NADP-dependent oxidoreductase [Solirubrobacteraceae bacterium]|nr:NADP-dependent oxidoreductase [Solirubrobacteraceae bacterium]